VSGLSAAMLVGCVPPPPEGAGTTTTAPAAPPTPTTPPPPAPTPPPTSPGGGLPNTPDGETFLAGKPLPGKSYDGDASRVQISGDGLWVVYHHATENLEILNRPPATCPKPPKTDTQIYRTNLVTQQTELVSVGTDGCYANGESSFPDTNSDGRYVVYMSKATNLPNSGGPGQDIFVKDMQTGVTTNVHLASNGAIGSGGSASRPDLSDDGSLVAYSSDATNLVPGDTNNAGDCFLTRRSNPSAVSRISVGDNGQQLDNFSYRCQLTANGSAAVFSSFATNVVGTPMATGQRIYVRDLVHSTTQLISRTASGTPATASRPDISSDGTCVTFQTSGGLVPGDTDGQDDVFLYEMPNGPMRLMSVDRAGNQVQAASTRIVVNADCTRVAFVSNSNKLVPEDKNGTRDTFMRDLRTNAIFLLSVNSAEQASRSCTTTTPTTTTTTIPGVHDPTGAEDISTRPSISDDGLVVAFISDTCGLVPEEPQMAGFDGVIVRWMR
jgi:Tol biopolymer transport system component